MKDLNFRELEILEMTIQEPRRWRDYRNRLELSEATLTNYLNKLKDLGLIEKGLNDDEKIIYSPVWKNIETEYKTQLIDHARKSQELVEELEERGLFEGTLNQDSLLEFFMENRERIEYFDVNVVEENSIELLESFVRLLKFLRPGKGQIELEFELGIKQDFGDYQDRVNKIEEHWKD